MGFSIPLIPTAALIFLIVTFQSFRRNQSPFLGYASVLLLVAVSRRISYIFTFTLLSIAMLVVYSKYGARSNDSSVQSKTA